MIKDNGNMNIYLFVYRVKNLLKNIHNKFNNNSRRKERINKFCDNITELLNDDTTVVYKNIIKENPIVINAVVGCKYIISGYWWLGYMKTYTIHGYRVVVLEDIGDGNYLIKIDGIDKK